MSYRARLFLRRLLIALLALAVAAVVLWVCWMVWLQRFIVYTPEGVKIDMSVSSEDISGQVAKPPAARDEVPVRFLTQEDLNQSVELEQILGFHISTDALLHDISTVSSQIDLLTPGSAIMLDLKSIYGNFYYSTDIPGAPVTDSLDPKQVDKLIEKITENDFYAIARVPAFRDRNFGLENTTAGLAVDGGYLWPDGQNCYWMDPTSDVAMAYLIQICSELRSLGFDEVVLCEFRFPDSDGEIEFDADITEAEAVNQAAAQLVSACSGGNFAVSFEGDGTLLLPEGRTRLYITGVPAEQASTAAAAFKVNDPAVNLVFMATSNDTRYNAYSALRSLEVGQNATGEEDGEE